MAVASAVGAVRLLDSCGLEGACAVLLHRWKGHQCSKLAPCARGAVISEGGRRKAEDILKGRGEVAVTGESELQSKPAEVPDPIGQLLQRKRQPESQPVLVEGKSDLVRKRTSQVIRGAGDRTRKACQ
jgi:hypothetical protein